MGVSSKDQQKIEILSIKPDHSLYEENTITFFSPSSETVQRYKVLPTHPTFKKNPNFWLREHYQSEGQLHSTVMPALKTNTRETWYFNGEIHSETHPAIILKTPQKFEKPETWSFSEKLLSENETIFNSSKNDFLNPTKTIEERLTAWYQFRNEYTIDNKAAFHSSPFRHFATTSHIYGLNLLKTASPQIYKDIRDKKPRTRTVREPISNLQQLWESTESTNYIYDTAETIFNIKMDYVPLQILTNQLTTWFNDKEKEHLEQTYNINL